MDTCLPSVFNVLVDASSNKNDNQSVVPRWDKHEGKTQAHPKEREGPADISNGAFNGS